MKNNKIDVANYSNEQILALTFLWILTGWYFLYEGLVKLSNPGWTSKGYLLGSISPLAPVLKGIAQSPTILNIADLMSEWGLVLIGISLFIGLFSKTTKIFGIILLSFHYLAYPPFASLGIHTHMEGSYKIVNKNLIEMAALFALYQFPLGHIT
jgi:thiosulfate dehydrogenase (quinone) large subunit